MHAARTAGTVSEYHDGPHAPHSTPAHGAGLGSMFQGTAMTWSFRGRCQLQQILFSSVQSAVDSHSFGPEDPASVRCGVPPASLRCVVPPASVRGVVPASVRGAVPPASVRVVAPASTRDVVP